MAAKSLNIEGYGSIMITPINIKENDAETCDTQGNPVKTKMVGQGAKRTYVNDKGDEIPNNQVCKKFIVEGEPITCPKFTMTKDVPADNVEVIDDASIVYTGIERKFYNVVTDNDKIKDLVITQNKSISFPFTAGMGWKLWRGVLTNWNGKLLLVLCRGDLKKELEKYNEETIEIEIEMIPQNVNLKKMMVMV